MNVIGLRRAGMLPADRRTLQDAFRILYRSGFGPARAVERIRDEIALTEPVRALLEFIAGATRHGIVGPFRGESATEPEEVSG
jgi:UDP-N-acetylglucosamine acyltransferase